MKTNRHAARVMLHFSASRKLKHLPGDRPLQSLHALSVAWLILLQIPAIGPEEAKFNRRLFAIEEQNPVTFGRDRLIRECQALIQDFENQPFASRAMLHAARLALLSNREAGYSPDKQTAQSWFSRAANAAPAGTSAWLDAKLGLVRLLRENPNDAAQMTAASAILKELESQVTPETKDWLTVSVDSFRQELLLGKFAEAESRCQRILDLPADSIKIEPPQLSLTAIQAILAREFLLAVVRSEDAPERRRQRVEAFATKYSEIDKIELAKAESLSQLIAWVDPPSLPSPAIDGRHSIQSTRRIWLLMVNGGVITALVIASLLRKFRAGQRV